MALDYDQAAYHFRSAMQRASTSLTTLPPAARSTPPLTPSTRTTSHPSRAPKSPPPYPPSLQPQLWLLLWCGRHGNKAMAFQPAAGDLRRALLVKSLGFLVVLVPRHHGATQPLRWTCFCNVLTTQECAVSFLASPWRHVQSKAQPFEHTCLPVWMGCFAYKANLCFSSICFQSFCRWESNYWCSG